MAIGDAVKTWFFFPFLWNYFLWGMQVGKLMSCNNMSVWGLFWFNDNGAMFQACLLTGPQGAKVDWIMP